MISVQQAISIVGDTSPTPRPEEVTISDALGRILAEDIVADCDLPPFDRSQMDGYAVRAADIAVVPTKLKIVGESAAGKGWQPRE